MIIRLTKIGKALFVSGLVVLFLFSFFGIAHSSMSMGEDGNMTMSNCPFMSGQAAVCNMNPLEHIAAWQGMFMSIPQQAGSNLIVLLLTAIALSFLWIINLWRPSINHTYSSNHFFVRKDYIPLASQLQELFSSGILNPKIY